jgi:hypothetical protein
VVDGEAQVAVQRDGGGVGRVDVEHAHSEAPLGQVIEAGQNKGPTEAQTLKVGVDRDDIDLAQLRPLVAVNLRPARGGQTPVSFVETKAMRVEPWFGLAFEQGVERPVPLFGMGGEGPVVDRQPRFFVAAWFEGSGEDPRALVLERQWSSHLKQIAPAPEA